MIARQTATFRGVPRTSYTPRRHSTQLEVLWQRVVDGYERALGGCSTESRIERAVRFAVRRPAEPGDEMLVNCIVEELSR